MSFQSFEKSCGVVVFKDDKVLLIHQTNDVWGFPKGHVESGETEEETALREVYEETHVKVKIIPGFREVISYSPKKNVIKDVVYFIGTCDEVDIINQEKEVVDCYFADYDEIKEKIIHEDVLKVFNKALDYKKNML